jgi:8-oxo-dGTP diphosphatase
MNRFDNVIFGQKAFIVDSKRRLLIMKRKSAEVYENIWDVPGGKREDGDTLKQAIAREIKEETGLALDKVLLALSSCVFRGMAVDSPLIFRNIYLCTANGKVKLSHEHSEYKWIGSSEIGDYEFPGDEDFVLALSRVPRLLDTLDLNTELSSLL